MPRRNQEAEDEAFAKALQDEYRLEYIRRQAEQNEAAAAAAIDADDGERDNANSSQRKKKSKKKSSKSKSKKGKKSRSNHRSRSSSRDSTGSNSGRDKRRRRRPRSNDRASDLSGDEWLATHYPDQMQQEETMNYGGVLPLPPPPFVEDQAPPDWGNHTTSDEAYARRIQQEMADAEYAQRLSEREGKTQRRGISSVATLVSYPVQDHRSARVSGVFASKDNSSSGSTGPLTDDDEMFARRMQQEMADAEYAERINNLEREEAASRGVILSIERQNQLNMAQRQQQQRRPKSCLATWVPMILCIAVAITVPLLYVFDIFNPADIPFLGDLFEDDWVGGTLNNMTFDDVNGTMVPQLPSNAIGWANTGNGLRLDILNACSDEWQPFVQGALDNWENGSPIDSLTFYTSRLDHDPKCSTVTGKLKICNGNYGDTQWRGINEVLLGGAAQRRIISSRAKLNEYYLNYESDAQKLYTSCHELGHGFGLPHWDEDFYNKDLGNCMDYTQNPHKSSKPDASNFLYLAQLYGGRDVNTNQELTAEEATTLVHENNAEVEASEAQKDKGKKNDGLNLGARHLFGSKRGLRHERALLSIPVSESRIVPHGENDEHSPVRRILHADERSEIHVFDSVDHPGHIVMQHYLLVQPDE